MALLGLRARADDQQTGVLLARGTEVRVERARERLRGGLGAAVADDADTAHPGLGLLHEPGGGDRDGCRAALQEALRGVADADVTASGVGVRAEHDHVGFGLRGKLAQALRRGAVGDDVASRVRPAEQLGAALEQSLGLVLGEDLSAGVHLGGVTHVCERHLCAGADEQPAERYGVVLVVGSVIGNDDVGRHG